VRIPTRRAAILNILTVLPKCFRFRISPIRRDQEDAVSWKMNDETVPKLGSDIPFADEDAASTDGASLLVASWITSRGLTNVERVDTCSRNVRSFTTFRASGLPAKREPPIPDDDNKMLNHRREPLEQRHARQSSVPKADRSALQRYENAVLKYQKPKLRPKRQASRERQQQQQNNCSSSDESVARNKSKSTSSIDTQSVNNILDEYEDLDYRRSSDLSDVGSISVSNFEAMMMNQQRRRQQQQQERFRACGQASKPQVKSIPTREKVQPVLKVNQQTQVRQRSRDRQKDSNKGHQQVASEEMCHGSSMNAIESERSKMPEMLLRKGEVQKRVDEWLNQAHSHNFPAMPREKPLTRSNSSAEQKSQRRYCQDSRSRSIDEARDRLNGGTSSSYDDLTRVDRRLERNAPDKVNVGVNTSRGTYKEYLAVRSKAKQQDYGFSTQSCVAASRSGDYGPVSRIPQRGPLGSSFRSRRAEANPEEKGTAENRIANLTKVRGESDYGRAIVGGSRMTEGFAIATTTTSTMSTAVTSAMSIIPCRRPSLKRSGSNDQNCSAAATRLLVKEETDPRSPRATGPSKGPLSAGNLDAQGEPISPNKDGESRRSAAAASGSTSRPAAATAADKAVEVVCKSTEVSTRCAANPRDRSSKIASAESDRVALESSRRRPQLPADVGRREPRSIDQARQEQSIYGLAVGARVRALQAESRSARSRCNQAVGAPMESKKPLILPRKDLAVSPTRDSQDRLKAPITAPSSSFKPQNRAYTATGVLQQHILDEPNTAKSRIAVCETVPSGRSTRYVSSDHVEKIYERSLQPQVIHANDLESILRSSLQISPYGEKVGVSRSDRESPLVKEKPTTLDDEQLDRIAESRHEHLETIEEDDRRSEASVCRYPEIGLKQCLKVQQSLPNGRSKESEDRRKDSSPICAKWDQQQQQQQQIILNEPARTFATFQSTSPCQGSVRSNVRSRSPENTKVSAVHEEVTQDPDKPTMILEDFAANCATRGDSDQLTIHSRENSNLSTATIPLDELESQRDSRFKTEEDPSRNRLDESSRSQDRAVEETLKDCADERGAVINEVLVKNLQFEQDLPEDPSEQTRSDHVAQQVNLLSVLCDDYENEKLRGRKMTKMEMDHQRLMDMLRKRDFQTLKMVSGKDITFSIFSTEQFSRKERSALSKQISARKFRET